MSFIDSYKQEISPEVALLMMPELKEDFLQDRPCKWEEITIELWKVASALIEDCDPSIENNLFCALRYFLMTKANMDISHSAKKQCKSK